MSSSPEQAAQPEPDREPDATPSIESQQDLPEPDALLPHDSVESERTLLPLFEAQCARLGRVDEPTQAERVERELFSERAIKLFGNYADGSQPFELRDLDAHVVEEWSGQRRLLIVAEFCKRDTGHSVLPLALALDDDAKLRDPAFWKAPRQEEFESPVGVIAKLHVGARRVEFEPLLPGRALHEALNHVKAVSSQIETGQRRLNLPYVFQLGAGSLLMSALLYKVQQSHESADCDAECVVGPIASSSKARRELSTGRILGVRHVQIAAERNIHEVSVVTLDTRRISSDAPPPTKIITALPLVEKVYRLSQIVEDANLHDPVVKSVRIEPFQNN